MNFSWRAGSDAVESQALFQRQRAVLFAEDPHSGATIGHYCTVLSISPYSKRKYPAYPDRWWVRIYLPHKRQFLEVRAGALMGLQERDDSELPAPTFQLEIACVASAADHDQIAGHYRFGWRWRRFLFEKADQPLATYHLYEQGKLFYYVPSTERLDLAYVERALTELFTPAK